MIEAHTKLKAMDDYPSVAASHLAPEAYRSEDLSEVTLSECPLLLTFAKRAAV
jgi:hypothetical protein